MRSGNRVVGMLACAAALLLARTPALADEGGVSFWLPGSNASLASVPGEPGWSLPVVYYHSDVSAGDQSTFRRNGRLALGLDGRADIVLAFPTYTFADPFWGGRASLGVGVGYGKMTASINGELTGPLGNTRAGSAHDSVDGFADLYPQFSVKWNRGVHNFMFYTLGGVPAGEYQAGRLANLGLNHWSIDVGGGYSYLNPKSGNEFSVTAGTTYNWRNKDTDYRNGIDGHVELGASHFFTPRTHAGLVGYYYTQFTGDTGGGATLGDFKSRVAAVGPQVGHFFEVGQKKWYVNAKAYYEFDANNRPKGWNVWLSLVIPLSGK